MMEVVADNEHPPPGPPGDPERTPPSGTPAVPGELSVRPPSEPVPPAIDPEAVRQFQQFQQFQELMRQQKEQGFPQGDPPPPGALQPWGPPPKQRPAWQRALRSLGGKLATAVIVVALLVLGGYLAVDYFLGGPPDQPKASEIGGQKTKNTLLFETNPRAAVQKIYDDVAQGEPGSACKRFTPQARTQFAEHLHRYGASCEEIVAAIHTGVDKKDMKDEYANPSKLFSISAQQSDEPVTISSCALGVEGGPPLGRFTVDTIPGSKEGQYIVTAHEAEPEDCTGVPTAPPTT